MITASQQSFLHAAFVSAKQAGHIWPSMAACEAALESTWGESELAKDNNLFGQKQQVHPIYGTIHIPTREFLHEHWITEDAPWVKFPTIADCFASRMDTLRRLSSSYPHYAAALAAGMPEVYVTQVSLSWSTDPERAAKCIEIFDAHQDLLK